MVVVRIPSARRGERCHSSIIMSNKISKQKGFWDCLWYKKYFIRNNDARSGRSMVEMKRGGVVLVGNPACWGLGFDDGATTQSFCLWRR